MRKIYDEYKKTLKYFINNKFYMLSIIIIAILAYGFYITNYSIGVDDYSQDRYVTGTYLLSQGRWGNVFFARLIGITEFVPFWTEFVAVSLFVFMSIILSTFIKKEIGHIVDKDIYYVLFSGLIISYPVIHHILLYNFANVITAVSNIAMIIVAIIIYENVFNIKKDKISIVSCIVLPFFISMYEASCQTFLVMVLAISFVELCKNESKGKKIIEYILTATYILAISIIINIIISYIIMLILEVNGKLMPDFSAKGTPWLGGNVISCFNALKHNIIDVYINDTGKLFYITVFFIAAIIAILISIIQSIKKKNIAYTCLITLMILANFVLNFIQIRVLYRTSISWPISIAFMVLYILICFRKNRITPNVLIVVIGFIILYNTKTLTYLFYNENVRYEREKYIAHDIANTIIKTCENPDKPLIFVAYNIGDLQGNSINLDNGWSTIGWGVWAFNEPGMETIKFINSLGYNLKCASSEEYKEGIKEFLEIKDEHKKDFVIELDKYIIIKVVNEPRNL